jgi:hypothetical protein
MKRNNSKKDNNNSLEEYKKKLGLYEEEEEEKKIYNNSAIISQNYGIKVYDFEAKKSLEDILKNSKLKAKYNMEARNYTQLIEDFELPNSTNCLALTKDGNHLWATGVYPVFLNF